MSCPDTPVNTDIMVDMVRVVVALAENSSVSLHPYVCPSNQYFTMLVAYSLAEVPACWGCMDVP